MNLDGKAIGINIARASRVSTYALPSRLIVVVSDIKLWYLGKILGPLKAKEPGAARCRDSGKTVGLQNKPVKLTFADDDP